MSEALTEKIDRIETLLREIKAKIDNFLGFEALDNEERNELQGLREAISSGEYSILPKFSRANDASFHLNGDDGCENRF